MTIQFLRKLPFYFLFPELLSLREAQTSLEQFNIMHVGQGGERLSFREFRKLQVFGDEVGRPVWKNIRNVEIYLVVEVFFRDEMVIYQGIRVLDSWLFNHFI